MGDQLINFRRILKIGGIYSLNMSMISRVLRILASQNRMMKYSIIIDSKSSNPFLSVVQAAFTLNEFPSHFSILLTLINIDGIIFISLHYTCTGKLICIQGVQPIKVLNLFCTLATVLNIQGVTVQQLRFQDLFSSFLAMNLISDKMERIVLSFFFFFLLLLKDSTFGDNLN